MESDYFLLLTVLGVTACCSSLFVTFIYRLGQAVRINLFMTGVAVAAVIAGFVLGKIGFSAIGVSLAVVIGLGCGLGPTMLLLKWVLNPMRQLSDAAARLAQGDPRPPLDIHVNSELGELAAALGATAAHWQTSTDVISQLAAGNLAVDISPRSDQDEFGRALNQLVATLRERIGQMAQSTAAMRQVTGAGRTFDGGLADQITDPARSKDELGELAVTFTDLATYWQNATSVVSQLAAGNLAVDVSPRSDQDEFGRALNQLVATLRDRIGQIGESADKMSKTAHVIALTTEQANQATAQISSTVQQIAQGIAQEAESLAKTVAAVDQMSETIVGVADGAQAQAAAVAQATTVTGQISAIMVRVAENAQAGAIGSAEAARTAHTGAATIEASVQSMQRIKASGRKVNEKVKLMGQGSEQISSIVETIEEIASQTNLLALNAAIEAARAGEHGRGFAIVADEVRKLAEKSAQATQEITQLIKRIQQTVTESIAAIEEETSEVEVGVTLSHQAAQALADILSAVEAINDQIGDVASAAQEMNTASGRLVESMETVGTVAERNTAATTVIAANSMEVSQAIENIASLSQENSAAIQEVNASVQETSARAAEISQATQSMSDAAVQLQQQVLRLTTTKITGKVSRGTALIGRLDFVKERYGQNALKRVLHRLDPGMQQLLKGKVEPEGEYPSEVLSLLTNAIRQELAGGSDEILREMTAFRAKFDVLPGGALAQHFRSGDPGFTIRRMDLCLRHNWGEGVIVRNFEVGPNHIRQEVDMGKKQPRERCTYNHVGWMEGVIQTAGGTPHIKKTKCMHDGDPYCEYDIHWENPKSTKVVEIKRGYVV